MLKSAILIFNTIALLMYQFFFADEITVTQKVPASAKPETEFTVELTIKKGATTGFAKLQQELPTGFTAVEDKNNGASFTFNNQSVKFIWMSLPNDEEFKISYKVKVAEGISGDQTIAGKFSYVTDNTKQTAEIAPATINIEGVDGAVASTNSTTTEEPTTTTEEPTTTTEELTTTTTTEEPTTTASASDNGDGSFNCVRTVPSEVPTEFIVELNVSKGNLGGFAKLVESLPEGFTASAVESAGGSFSFADQKVRYIWVSLPSQPEFKITYKVKAPKNAGTQSIDGVFSYIEEDETRKFIIAPTNVTVGEGSGAVATTTTTTTTTSDQDNTLSLSANTINAPQSGVNYHVQILALQNRRSASSVANLYNMSGASIMVKSEEGFAKYLTGTHNEYKAARDARENIKSRGVVAPFVTAYNSGRRITVQDALMMTSQKWYR